ncbi:MAG: hypothetical protein L0H75_10040 [Nitrosospira sp.]|nr:hypothetical protein [Nitrosospira sp.]
MAENLPPIKLVKREATNDVKEAFERLLGEAKMEKILGSVTVVLYEDRHFEFVLAGECYRNPLYTRCLVAELDDELSVLTK